MAQEQAAKKKKKASLKNITMESLVVYLRLYMFPIFAVLCLGLMTFFVYMPYIEVIPELLTQEKKLGENLNVLDDNLSTLNTINDLPLSTMESELDAIIPTEPKVAALADTLISLAEDSGLDVTVPTVPEEEETTEPTGEESTEETITPEDVALEELSASERERYANELGVLPVPVELQLVGTRDELEAFLLAVSQEDRVITVSTMSAQIQGGYWNVELVLYGYQGAFAVGSLSDYETISAESDKVFSAIRRVNINVSEERFDQVTSKF